MTTDHRAALARIKRFDQLIAYLRDEMGWPIARDSFEDVEDLFYDFTADELGIDPKTAAKIESIKRLRPLSPRQPWGIFFVKFEPKRLPVVALRRILSQVALKKRASANSAERGAWAADDLLFVSNYGEGDERQISFAHFSKAAGGHDLPTLKVLGWDNLDTALHLDAVAKELAEHLGWPDDESDVEAWRQRWRAAFTLRHREVVTTAKGLSIRLAELARATRDRIKAALAIETERGPLTKLLKAFQESLVHDLDADGFADMYAQTIAYGLLSARITNPLKRTADDFAGHMRTNPFLKELMETFLTVGGRRGRAGGPGIDFDELGVGEVVVLLDEAQMEAVVRDFGDRNPQEDPVIHFYELFLTEYDAKKRMQRGVFYTPRPVVSYIVRSVDTLLRTEFGLADGLADTTTWGELARSRKDLVIPKGTSESQPFVQILDPATGTGTFLVEVIEVIYRTLSEKWRAEGSDDRAIDALWNEYVPKHLLPRLYGYEILMAPYAIAHLKVGLKLFETCYHFGSDQRARIYLTNSLEPASLLADPTAAGLFEVLGREAQAVNEVKRTALFTVVMGNPPYAGHSLNNDVAWIVDKVYDYKRGHPDLQKPGQAKWLQDDYVKFIRFAETLLSVPALGMLGYITNHSFLDNPTFRGMRLSLLKSFPRIDVLNLNGNASERQLAPDGERDENVFDIQQGVSISLCIRGGDSTSGVRYRDLFGSREAKYTSLLREVDSGRGFEQVIPEAPHFAFLPGGDVSRQEFDLGQPISRLMSQNGDPAAGIVTTHDEFAISWSAEEASEKVDRLLATKSESEARSIFRLCSQAQWDYQRAKRELQNGSWRSDLCQVLYRPFDLRWTVFNRNVAVHRRERVMRHMMSVKNVGLVCVRNIPPGASAPYAFVSRHVIVNGAIRPSGSPSIDSLFPLYLVPEVRHGRALPLSETDRSPNFEPLLMAELSRRFRLTYQGVGHGDLEAAFGAEDVFQYVYACLYSGSYRARYRRFLESEFPAVQFPQERQLFAEIVRLGGELVDLHLMDSDRLEKRLTTYFGPTEPEVGRVGWSDGTVWLDAASAKKGQPATPGTVGFRGVPKEVWDFHVGGHQVCERWLKDRKGRKLSKNDIIHYEKLVVALNETVRVMREVDQAIEKQGGWPVASKSANEGTATSLPASFPPRIDEPPSADRYVTCVPLVPLKIAAGAFSDPQRVEDDTSEWVEIDSTHRLRPGMFVAQVVGRSMEPTIPNGSFCLFAAPVTGSQQGKTVLARLRDATDPETGERYTVKRYESEKAKAGDSWRHARITLRAVNPEFEPIVLTGAEEGQVQVIAECIEVLRPRP